MGPDNVCITGLGASSFVFSHLDRRLLMNIIPLIRCFDVFSKQRIERKYSRHVNHLNITQINWLFPSKMSDHCTARLQR